MTNRGRAIGVEHAETEAQTEALNESLERDKRRREIAKEIAFGRYSDSAAIIFEPFDSADDWTNLGVESRDGGYWVAAKVWIDAEGVEEKLNETPRTQRIREYFEHYGEGRQEDMTLDLDDPAQYLLVQRSPSDSEIWYVLLPSPEDAVQYIRQDYPPWDFEALIDLDTDEELELETHYEFKLKSRS